MAKVSNFLDPVPSAYIPEPPHPHSGYYFALIAGCITAFVVYLGYLGLREEEQFNGGGGGDLSIRGGGKGVGLPHRGMSSSLS